MMKNKEEVEHTALKVYPKNYTGNSFERLNEMLKEGWTVKQVVPENPAADYIIYVYILERVKSKESTIINNN